MGRQLLAAALADPAFALSGGLVRGGSPLAGQDLGTLAGLPPAGVPASDETAVAAVLAATDVLVDFTQAAATPGYAAAAAAHGCAFLTGTSGLDAAGRARVAEAAARVPVLIAANTSAGVTALLRLLPDLARMLGSEYDLEIIETHHRHKADAPSGTALAILDALAGATVATPGGREDGMERAVFGRRGRAPRRPGEIGVHAVRAGGAIGEHRVIIAGAGEQLEIVHRADDRRTYAAGALRAARWLAGQPPGCYGMADTLDTMSYDAG